jgi:hypothetical protein
MADRIEFDGDNLILPADIQGLLNGLATAFQRRLVSAVPLSGEQSAYMKQMAQFSATSSLSLGGLPMCALASPPEPIQSGFDSKNNLRLQCLHKSPHCWSLSGIKQNC